MYTLEDVYKTFPSRCTEDYKILRAFEMGKQASEKRIAELTDELKALRESIKDYGAGCYENGLRNGKRKLGEQFTKAKELLAKWVELFKPKLEGYPITPIQEQTEQFLNSEGK